MADRYLFRGKDRDTGEWRIGNLSYYGHKRYIDTTPTDGGRHNSRVDPATVGQCIGITDRAGNAIFEGDIIQTYFSFKPGDAGYGISQRPFVVEWQQQRCAYWGCKPGIDKDKHYFHILDTTSFFEMQSELYDVIGNIHDSPELLTEGGPSCTT